MSTELRDNPNEVEDPDYDSIDIKRNLLEISDEDVLMCQKINSCVTGRIGADNEASKDMLCEKYDEEVISRMSCPEVKDDEHKKKVKDKKDRILKNEKEHDRKVREFSEAFENSPALLSDFYSGNFMFYRSSEYDDMFEGSDSICRVDMFDGEPPAILSLDFTISGRREEIEKKAESCFDKLLGPKGQQAQYLHEDMCDGELPEVVPMVVGFNVKNARRMIMAARQAMSIYGGDISSEDKKKKQELILSNPVRYAFFEQIKDQADAYIEILEFFSGQIETGEYQNNDFMMSTDGLNFGRLDAEKIGRRLNVYRERMNELKKIQRVSSSVMEDIHIHTGHQSDLLRDDWTVDMLKKALCSHKEQCIKAKV